MTSEQRRELTEKREKTARAEEAYRQAFTACCNNDQLGHRCDCDETEAEYRFCQRALWVAEAVYTKAAKEAS